MSKFSKIHCTTPKQEKKIIILLTIRNSTCNIQFSSPSNPFFENATCQLTHGYTGFTDWKNAACSASCGPGSMFRTRDCTQPKPQNGGKVPIKFHMTSLSTNQHGGKVLGLLLKFYCRQFEINLMGSGDGLCVFIMFKPLDHILVSSNFSTTKINKILNTRTYRHAHSHTQIQRHTNTLTGKLFKT